MAARVVFAGAEPHAREALCAMDVLASPSEQETFGLAVIEGLAAGLPVLYTTCPPLDELGDAVAEPNAVKLPADAASFREALAAQLSTLDDTERNPLPPAVAAAYDIKLLAESVTNLYADLRGREGS
jgi:glycosyltransferase involved in cell wall biosynthesis